MNNEELVEQIYKVLVERFGISEILFPQTVEDKNKVVTWKEFIKLVCIDNFNGTDLASILKLRSISNLSRYFKKYHSSIVLSKNKLYWKSYLLNLINSHKCTKCLQVLPRETFYIQSGKIFSRCKSCVAEEAYKHRESKALYDKNRYLCNKEEKSLYDKEYYLKNRDKKLLYTRMYRLANTKNVSLAIRNHYLNNKAVYNAYSAKRRAAKLQATPQWANQEAIKLIYATVPKGYHVDHIIPLQNPLVCGLHCEFNLQHLSAHDNLSKGNKYEP